MDFFVADPAWRDTAVIAFEKLDMGIGEENSFHVTVPVETAVPYRSLIYAPGTEFGGIVDARSVDSTAGTVTYSGRTWQGVLAGNTVIPPDGKTHLEVAGEANVVLGELIAYLGLGELFEHTRADSGVEVSYAFERFTDAYTGIRKMLVKHGGKLMFAKRGKVELSALPIPDRTDELDSMDNDITVTEDARPVNHEVCLGKGEGLDRIVINLYADADGNVSSVQTLFGADHRSETYDYSGADYDELLERGTERLEKLQEGAKVSVFLDGGTYDIDDKVSAYESNTGAAAEASVAEKILRIDSDGNVDIEYRAGDGVLSQRDFAETMAPQAWTRVSDGYPSAPYLEGTQAYVDGRVYVAAMSRADDEVHPDDWLPTVQNDLADHIVVTEDSVAIYEQAVSHAPRALGADALKPAFEFKGGKAVFPNAIEAGGETVPTTRMGRRLVRGGGNVLTLWTWPEFAAEFPEVAKGDVVVINATYDGADLGARWHWPVGYVYGEAVRIRFEHQISWDLELPINYTVTYGKADA